MTPPDGGGLRSLFRLPRSPEPLLLSGLLLGLAHPPVQLLAPTFVALVPLGLWLAWLPPGTGGRREALRGGFLLGLVYFTLTLYWLVVALIFYTPLAVLAFLLPVLILSSFLALAAAGIHGATERLGAPIWLALPVFWTAMEWLRAHLGDVSFPWMKLGETLAGFPWLLGIADLVGGRGVTFWVVLVNGLLAALLLRVFAPDPPGWARRLWIVPGARDRAPGAGRRAGGAARWLAAALALVVAAPTAYSLYRWETLETRPAARVGVVQPNVPEDIKLDPWAALDSTLTSLGSLSRRELEAEAGRLDLVVMPETTIPGMALDSIPSVGWPGLPGARRWMARLARRLEAPILFGGVGVEPLPGEGFRHFNSAFLLDGRGRRVARYDKRRLVPVIERVPFVDPAAVDFLDVLGPYFGSMSIGVREAPMAVPGSRDVRFGVLVCYESIFPGLARDYRRRGADFLVNMTNDAWYGREEPAWSRTSALWQHPAHLVMRAVENRVGIVRSANTGISEVVDPLGRTSHRTPLFEARAFTATVATTSGRTLYARVGDVAGWASALLAAGAVLALGAGVDRRRSPTGYGEGDGGGPEDQRA